MANKQFSLDLGRPPRSDILYFALRPDAVAARAMTEVARRFSKRLNAVERLHVSLVPAMSPRGFRKDDVAAAWRAAARVRARPFRVDFDRICTFQGRGTNPIVLCCGNGAAAMTALRDTLRLELIKAGLWRGLGQFQPHVTLWWDRTFIPPTCLDQPVRWTVDDFVLVRSLIGRGRHIDLGRWPLSVGEDGRPQASCRLPRST